MLEHNNLNIKVNDKKTKIATVEGVGSLGLVRMNKGEKRISYA